jgi:hypothetical protein
MVEAPNPLGAYPTSIPYINTVFKHLDMPWMGIQVHPYTVTPVQVGGGFLENWDSRAGVRLESSLP